ncbi:hypothetical protein [Pseudolabrys sp. FHR47]|uniref:hypothetical protein n=1 Tax=Pseudolabrys sp. FHR47 TaxID=2562284 RepID=UPI0010BE7176|nr:hypothetical protein [Pseudolabrys sp. FHR47]
MFVKLRRSLAALSIAAVCLLLADGAARAEEAPARQFAETPQPVAPRATPPAPAKPPASGRDLKPSTAVPTLAEQVRSLQASVETLQADVAAMKARLQNAEKDVGTLRSGMTALQNKLSEYLAKVSFTCKSASVSRSGSGVEENCSPYRCRAIDGRCAPQTCNSVDDCAPGYVCLPGVFKCSLP